MSAIVDNLIAYKILSMLVTPFTETEAYKLAIIDAEGKNLRKVSSLKTSEEKDAYNYLYRLVFNMKRILGKLPGGDTKMKNLVAALWLIKEYYQSKDRTTSLMEQKYKHVLDKLNEGVIFVEEEIELKRFIEYISEEGEGGAPANNTSGASVTEPVVKKKDIKKYQSVNRRPVPVEVKSK